jgi:DNA-binding HxlR family transcriptional regulator
MLTSSEKLVDERRVVDAKWKVTVEAQLKEGVTKFGELAKGHENILKKLAENTAETTEIRDTLNRHIENYQTFTAKVEPAIVAIDTMQSGVRAIGKFGNACAWVGQNVRKIIVWLTPIVALVLTVWHFITTGGKI